MLLDICIHDKLHHSSEALYKARVLTAIIGIYFAIITSVEIWLVLSQNSQGIGLKSALIICAVMQVAYIGALSLLKYKGWYAAVGNFTIAATAIGIAGGVAISGGPMVAPATPMSILPITMAFVLINKRSGLIWTLAVIFIHVGFMAVQHYGFVFPQMLEPEFMNLQHIAHWLVIYTAMIGLLALHDTMNKRLRVKLNTERNTFQYMASHDPLTRLANRMQFDECLSKAISRSNRYGRATALFFIDLDGFKPINDTLGHDAGDIVLKEIAHRLQQNIRELDTAARLGGDEFAIILEDIEDADDLEKLATKILEIIKRPVLGLSSQPHVSGSLGIALYPQHCSDKEQLIKYADTAMYKAKKEKNQWCMYEEEAELQEVLT